MARAGAGEAAELDGLLRPVRDCQAWTRCACVVQVKALVLFALLRSAVYEVACIWAQDTGHVQDAKKENTIWSWKKFIFRVLIALTRASVRWSICMFTLGLLYVTFGWGYYVLYRDNLYPSHFDPEMVACVVEEDASACRRLH